ncbi:NAD(P)-binding protein [Staphylococcus aureus]|nr:NAD(P)-binding protein [Staphylococcus aureus]
MSGYYRSGITGLSSAYFLKQQDPNIDVTIFEASNRPGKDSIVS